jgi:hypothetical protein
MLGMVRKIVKVKTYPEATETLPAGDFILKSIPLGVPQADCFIKDSHFLLEALMLSVKAYFSVTAPHVVTEWKEFLELCPKNDYVEDYLVDHPLYIPLRETLFGDKRNEVINASATETGSGFKTMPCVSMGQRRDVSSVPIAEYDISTGDIRNAPVERQRKYISVLFIAYF